MDSRGGVKPQELQTVHAFHIQLRLRECKILNTINFCLLGDQPNWSQAAGKRYKPAHMVPVACCNPWLVLQEPRGRHLCAEIRKDSSAIPPQCVILMSPCDFLPPR